MSDDQWAAMKLRELMERVRKARGLPLTEINRENLAYIESGDV